MQVLNFAFEFVAVSGIALYAYLFVSGLVSRQAVSAPACELIPDVLIDTDELVAEMARISDEVRSCWVAEAIEVPNFVTILEDVTLESLGGFTVSDVEVAEAIEWQPTAIDTVVPFKRPVRKTDWAAMNSYKLREACSLHGIHWRNAHGKNRHLSKVQMVTALQVVEVARCSTTVNHR